MTIQNTNTSTGTITIGSNNLFLSTGAFSMIIGSPALSTASTPSNVSTATIGSGVLYFGPSGFTASGPTNYVNAINNNVQISTGSSPASAISLGGGDVINGGQYTITSLDLTSAANVTTLTTLQSEHIIGGTLTVGGGIATGGNVIFYSNNNLTSVSAENIPASVTVTFNGFFDTNTVGINITGASTTTQAIVNGTEQFTNSIGTTSTITITTNQATTPVFSIGNGGSLTSDEALSITSGGNTSISGGITSANNFTMTASGPITVGATGSITCNGNNFTMTAAGSISISGSIHSSDNLTLNNSSSGSITGTGSVTCTNIFLGGSGNTTTINLSNGSYSNLTFHANSDVTLTDSHSIGGNGTSVSGGNILITDTTNDTNGMSFNNSVTATGTLTLTNTGTNEPISFSNNITGTIVTFTATGSGAIEGNQFSAIIGSTSVNLTSGSGTMGYSSINPLLVTTPNLTFNTTGDVFISDSQALTSNGVSTGGNVYLANSANGGMTTTNTITATGTLQLVNTGTNSPITIGANVSGTVTTLTATGTGVITFLSSVLGSTVGVGNSPHGVAINQAGTYAYVTNYSNNTVSVIQTSNNTILTTINVGSGPYGVAINPAGTYAYVANQGSGTVSVIQISNNTVVATVSVGNSPAGIAVNPAGTYVYVSNAADGTVSVIQTNNNTVVATVSVGGGTNPQGIAITPNGAYAYVATGTGNTISVIQTSNNTVVHTIVDFGGNPSGVAVNPAGTFVYVTNADANTVSVIQTSNNTIVGTINVGNTPFGIALDPSGGYGYVQNNGGGTVSVFQTSNNSVVSTLNVGSAPISLSNFVGTVGNNVQAYIANSGSNNVSIIQEPTVIGSSSVTATSSSGAIGGLNILTPHVTFSTSGNVALYDLQALTGNGASSGGSVSFIDNASGGITTTNTITATGFFNGTLSLIDTGANAPIALGASISGTVDTLTATGSGTITQTGGTITGTTSETFTSGSGAIGSLNIVTPNWTSATTGNVTLVDSQATTGNGNSVGNNISFTDTAGGAGSLTVATGTVTATGTLTLATTGGTNGGIVINSNVSGTADTITATGSGGISGSGSVTGTTSVSLASPTGTINLATLVTPNITTTQNTGGAGSITLTDSQALTGNGISTAGTGGFSLTDTANGGITTTVSSSITSGGNLSLIDSGTNSPIVIGADLSGTTVNLTATGSGTITKTNGITTGSTSVTLTSNSGSIGSSGSPIAVVTPNITANTTGDVTIIDTQAITGNGTSTGNNFTLSVPVSFGTPTPGTALTITNPITATAVLTLDCSNGLGAGLAVNSSLSGSTVILKAGSSGTITGGGTITGTSVSATSGTGSINLTGLATANITANTSATAQVLLDDSVAVTGNGASSAGSGGFTLNDSANGGITTTASITTSSAGPVSLIDSGTNSPISVGATLGGTTVTLTATGSGGISGSSTITGTTSVVLSSPTGAINLSALATPNITTTQTLSSGGSVTLIDTVALTGHGVSTVGTGGYSLTDNAGIALTHNITGTGGSVSFLSSGTISEAAAITIAASAITFKGTSGVTLNGLLTAVNNVTVDSNSQITVAGTSTVTSTGGNVGFAAVSGAGNVTLQNNGIIHATGGSGIVGINGTSTGIIAITGTGSMSGGQAVNIGNLDSSSLQILPLYVVVNPFTGTYTNQLGNITITQGAIAQPLQVSTGFAPPPTPSGGGSSSSSSGSGNNLFNLNYYLSLQQSAQQQALNRLDEQIGTKIATDYTPWTTYPMQPKQYPLQGSVTAENDITDKQALFAASSFNAEELIALDHQGIVFGPSSKDNFFDLIKGFVLFMPKANIDVQTREGVVSIPKGAVAWVMETGNDAAIYDLHDNIHTGYIKVNANKKSLTLTPGTEILLTRNNTASFDTLNPGTTIGYRNVRSSDLGGGIKAYICDFSIAHGLNNVPTMRSLLTSNDKAQRDAAWQMIKNATILDDLTGGAAHTQHLNEVQGTDGEFLVQIILVIAVFLLAGLIAVYSGIKFDVTNIYANVTKAIVAGPAKDKIVDSLVDAKPMAFMPAKRHFRVVAPGKMEPELENGSETVRSSAGFVDSDYYIQDKEIAFHVGERILFSEFISGAMSANMLGTSNSLGMPVKFPLAVNESSTKAFTVDLKLTTPPDPGSAKVGKSLALSSFRARASPNRFHPAACARRFKRSPYPEIP